jgi:Glyoxalase/Bleomycin resistance protein/Dioxygenase superfamily
MATVSFLFGAPGKGLDLYHVGLTVPDLHEAMELYSRAFGFDWATVHERSPTVIVDGVSREAEIAVTYSVQGPPYLELVEERRGDIWGAAGLSLTHVGFWAEDIDAARGGLEAMGLPTRMHAPDIEGAPMRFSYHQTSSGLWIELVHTRFKAELADWIAATLEQK